MIEFKLPSLGADMDEGTLLEWRVQPGDSVHRGQVIAVVDTVKAAIDVECWDEGTVDTLIAATGAKLPVGAVLALLRAPGESAEQAQAWKAQRAAAKARAAQVPTPAQAVAAVPPVAAATPAGRRRISPVARRRAEELGVDVLQLAGSGPDGAISIEDVERAAAKAPAAPPGRAEMMRRTIAAAMARSKREIPHYYLTRSVLLERATRWLTEQNAARPVTARMLMAALFIAAVAKALQRFPEFNGYFRDGTYQPQSDIHVGLAISLRAGGVIAPALLNANSKTLEEIMREMTDLVRRARTYTLKSSELASATVTLTSLGDGAADTVLGVIYPPQVALVGFGTVTARACVERGEVRAAPTVTLSLAADHRVSDGHRAARFLAAIESMLQQPEML